MKVLLLCFDVSRFSSTGPVESLLANHKDVSAWSSPFRGVYAVQSELSAKEFARTLDSFFDNRGFMVSEIDGSSNMTNGRVIQEVWDFIKFNNNAQAH